MTTRIRRIAGTLLVVLLAIPACREESPVAPPPALDDAPSQSTSRPTEAAPQSSKAPPPPSTMREALGKIARLELMKADKAFTTRTKQLDILDPKRIEAVLDAIGLDQVAAGLLRRCPDVYVVVLFDAAGAAKGEIGLCGARTLGPEFTPAGGERKGITLANEASLRDLLDLQPPPAPELR